jgi:hypothetical protein
MIPVAALLLAATAVACGESAAHKAARQLARRNSCVAAELALSAKERAAKLDTQVVASAGTQLEPVLTASRQFALAYQSYAQAFSHSADLADSAASAGSKREAELYRQQATQTSPPAPMAGSVEGNAAGRFTADMQAALANPDHPCNHPDDADGS